jgi:hypothetical protein
LDWRYYDRLNITRTGGNVKYRKREKGLTTQVTIRILRRVFAPGSLGRLLQSELIFRELGFAASIARCAVDEIEERPLSSMHGGRGF